MTEPPRTADYPSRDAPLSSPADYPNRVAPDPTTHAHSPQPGPTIHAQPPQPNPTSRNTSDRAIPTDHSEPDRAVPTTQPNSNRAVPTDHPTSDQVAPTNRRGTAATVAVLVVAFLGVLLVWALSAWSSFSEQTRLSQHETFTHPALLPWTLDGLAFALALIALAAALDGRLAIAARLGVVLAISASVWSNVSGVSVRSGEEGVTQQAFVIAAIAPISAMVSFEVILAAVRRMVFRWRGQPPPVAIPTLRLIRILLAPWSSFWDWRREVLMVTGGIPVPRRHRVIETESDPTDKTDATTDTAEDADPADTADPIDPGDYFAELEHFAKETPPEAWDRPPEPPDRSTGPDLPPPGPVEQAGGRTDRPEAETVDRSEPVNPEPDEPPEDPDPPTGRKQLDPDRLEAAYRAYETALLGPKAERMTATKLAPILDVTEDRARTIRRTKLDPRFLQEHPDQRLRLVG